MVDQQYDPIFLKTIGPLLAREGGVANNPNDKGGYTKYGISSAAHPGLDVKDLTLPQATKIYYNEYWKGSGADKIEDPTLRELHFDAAVNQGVGTAKHFMAESQGNPNKYADLRLASYQEDLKDPTQRGFAHSWITRVNEIMGKKKSGSDSDQVWLPDYQTEADKPSVIPTAPLGQNYNDIVNHIKGMYRAQIDPKAVQAQFNTARQPDPSTIPGYGYTGPTSMLPGLNAAAQSATDAAHNQIVTPVQPIPGNTALPDAWNSFLNQASFNSVNLPTHPGIPSMLGNFAGGVANVGTVGAGLAAMGLAPEVVGPAAMMGGMGGGALSQNIRDQIMRFGYVKDPKQAAIVAGLNTALGAIPGSSAETFAARALGNAARFGAGSAGVNVGEQLAGGQPFNAGQALQAGAMGAGMGVGGALFHQPTNMPTPEQLPEPPMRMLTGGVHGSTLPLSGEVAGSIPRLNGGRIPLLTGDVPTTTATGATYTRNTTPEIPQTLLHGGGVLMDGQGYTARPGDQTIDIQPGLGTKGSNILNVDSKATSKPVSKSDINSQGYIDPSKINQPDGVPDTVFDSKNAAKRGIKTAELNPDVMQIVRVDQGKGEKDGFMLHALAENVLLKDRVAGEGELLQKQRSTVTKPRTPADDLGDAIKDTFQPGSEAGENLHATAFFDEVGIPVERFTHMLTGDPMARVKLGGGHKAIEFKVNTPIGDVLGRLGGDYRDNPRKGNPWRMIANRAIDNPGGVDAIGKYLHSDVVPDEGGVQANDFEHFENKASRELNLRQQQEDAYNGVIEGKLNNAKKELLATKNHSDLEAVLDKHLTDPDLSAHVADIADTYNKHADTIQPTAEPIKRVVGSDQSAGVHPSELYNQRPPDGFKVIGDKAALEATNAAELHQGHRQVEYSGTKYNVNPSEITRIFSEAIEANKDPSTAYSLDLKSFNNLRGSTRVESPGSALDGNFTPIRFLEGDHGIAVQGVTDKGRPRQYYIDAHASGKTGIVEVPERSSRPANLNYTDRAEYKRTNTSEYTNAAQHIRTFNDIIPGHPGMKRIDKMFNSKTQDFKAIQSEIERLYKQNDLEHVLKTMEPYTGKC